MVFIIGLVLFIYFENFVLIIEDKFLIVIFGGLFFGVGIGFMIKNGVVLDGVEILGIFVNEYYGISIGKVILIFNVIFFVIMVKLFFVEVVMYLVFIYFVMVKVIDYMIEGFEDYIGLLIVLNEVLVLEKLLIEEVGMGMIIY